MTDIFRSGEFAVPGVKTGDSPVRLFLLLLLAPDVSVLWHQPRAVCFAVITYMSFGAAMLPVQFVTLFIDVE